MASDVGSPSVNLVDWRLSGRGNERWKTLKPPDGRPEYTVFLVDLIVSVAFAKYSENIKVVIARQLRFRQFEQLFDVLEKCSSPPARPSKHVFLPKTATFLSTRAEELAAWMKEVWLNGECRERLFRDTTCREVLELPNCLAQAQWLAMRQLEGRGLDPRELMPAAEYDRIMSRQGAALGDGSHNAGSRAGSMRSQPVSASVGARDSSFAGGAPSSRGDAAGLPAGGVRFGGSERQFRVPAAAAGEHDYDLGGSDAGSAAFPAASANNNGAEAGRGSGTAGSSYAGGGVNSVAASAPQVFGGKLGWRPVVRSLERSKLWEALNSNQRVLATVQEYVVQREALLQQRERELQAARAEVEELAQQLQLGPESVREADMRQECEKLRRELEASDSRHAALEETVAGMRAERAVVEREIDDLRYECKTLSQLAHDLDSAERLMLEAEERRKKAEGDRAAQQEELAALQLRCDRLERQHDVQVQERAEALARDAVAAADEQLRQERRRGEALQAANEELQAAVEAARGQVDAERRQQERKLLALEEVQTNSAQQLSVQEQLLEQTRRELAAAQDQELAQSEKSQELQARIADLEVHSHKAEELRQRVQLLEQAAAAAALQASAAADREAGLQQERAALEAQLRQQQAEGEAAAAELVQKQQLLQQLAAEVQRLLPRGRTSGDDAACDSPRSASLTAAIQALSEHIQELESQRDELQQKLQTLQADQAERAAEQLAQLQQDNRSLQQAVAKLESQLHEAVGNGDVAEEEAEDNTHAASAEAAAAALRTMEERVAFLEVEKAAAHAQLDPLILRVAELEEQHAAAAQRAELQLQQQQQQQAAGGGVVPPVLLQLRVQEAAQQPLQPTGEVVDLLSGFPSEAEPQGAPSSAPEPRALQNHTGGGGGASTGDGAAAAPLPAGADAEGGGFEAEFDLLLAGVEPEGGSTRLEPAAPGGPREPESAALQEMAAKVEKAEQRSAWLEASLARSNSDCQDSRAALAAAEAELQRTRGELEEVRAELRDRELDLAGLMTALGKTQEDANIMAQCSSSEQELVARVSEMQQNLNKRTAALAEVRGENGELRNNCRQLMAEVEQLRSMTAGLQEREQVLKAQLESLQIP